jgi:hypothetical protein
MTIAIHISNRENESIWQNFNFKYFTAIASEKSTDHFIFIFDRSPGKELTLDPNCTPVILGPAITNILLRHYWYNYKLPSILERYNTDVFISADYTCSLRTKVPHCLIIHEISLKPKLKSNYWKRYLPQYLDISKQIFVTNNVVQQELQESFNIAKEKIQILYPGIDKPLTDINPDDIKNKYTEGKDYFLYDTSGNGTSDLITLLKAFSQFKKWQKSEMMLLVLLRSEIPEKIKKEISAYKYRDELLMLIAPSDAAILLSAAYGVIAFSDPFTFPAEGLLAINNGSALITNETKINTGIFGNTALYVQMDEKDIADKMMLLYKDEYLRAKCIIQGKALLTSYSEINTMDTLWQGIHKIVNQ